MARRTPAGVAEKWARNLKGATEEIRRGVAAVTESPPQKAAENMDKIRERWLASLDRMREGLMGVPVEEWRRLTEAGIGKISIGVDAKGKARMERAMTGLLPHIEAGQAKLRGMPSVTLEDNIARMDVFIRHMAAYKRE